jgi:hypothetical protein
MACKCSEELLIDHEIKAGKCMTCMMLEFQEEQGQEQHES